MKTFRRYFTVIANHLWRETICQEKDEIIKDLIMIISKSWVWIIPCSAVVIIFKKHFLSLFYGGNPVGVPAGEALGDSNPSGWREERRDADAGVCERVRMRHSLCEGVRMRHSRTPAACVCGGGEETDSYWHQRLLINYLERKRGRKKDEEIYT